MSQPGTPAAADAPILVVDDEDVVRIALRELLRQQGYRVHTASDPVQALGLLGRQAFAAVLADHQMPRLSGLEFLAEVKRRQPDASRLLISGLLAPETVLDAVNRVEICRCIPKPWQRDQLLAAVRDAVSRHREITQQRQLLQNALARCDELSRRIEALERQPPP
ncbi:MAG: response regulator [Verrucomicrobia bacterium]|nr:response regulator [Verrucomicrobiota bacterium]